MQLQYVDQKKCLSIFLSQHRKIACKNIVCDVGLRKIKKFQENSYSQPQAMPAQAIALESSPKILFAFEVTTIPVA